METQDLLKKVRKIEIKTRGLSSHIFSGEYHSAFKGRGMAFSEVREYMAGDDIRAIDWNVTARFNHPFVKVFEEERELTVILLVDVSASEEFGTKVQFKKDLVTELCAVLSFSAIQNNDKIGIIFFSDIIEKFIPPKKGKSHILRIIRELIEFTPKHQKTNISNALRYLTNVIKKRSICFVISDFMDDPALPKNNFEDGFKLANKKHDIVALQVYDQRETELPNAGMVRFRHAETGELLTVDTSDERVRTNYKKNWELKQRQLNETFARSGVDKVLLRSDQSYVQPLMQLFKKREKMISDLGLVISDLKNKCCNIIRNFAVQIFIFSFCILHSAFSFAQNIKAEAKPDTNQIRIGEQFHLNLSVTSPVGTKLIFPLIPDTIKKLEIIQRSKIDTAKSADGKTTTLLQKLTLTCFDSGFYVIEPIQVYFQQAGKADTDSVSTEAQLITVKTIPVDTTKEFKDIKSPLDVPYTWKELLPYIIGAVVLIVLILLIIREIRRRKNKVVVVKKKIPTRPAHEIALEALKKTEEEKLWQQGFYKKYHSQVADIIRAYIDHRFSINAMEFTSDETLDHLRGNIINDEAREKLSYILKLADMVKFAKAQPIANENEQSLSNAYHFIALTKTVTPDDFKEKEDES